MHTSSPLSLSLSEVSVSDSSSTLLAKQSSSIFYHLYHFAAYILQEVLKIVVGEMFVFLVVVVVVVFLRYIQDSSSSVPFVFRFYKLIWKLFPIQTQRHIFTVRISGPPQVTRVNFCEPVVLAMLLLVTLKVCSTYMLFLHVQDQAELTVFSLFLNYCDSDIFLNVFST